MNLFVEVKSLLIRELRREFVKNSSIFSVVLYIVSISYLLYFLLNIQGALVHLEVKYWNILFWLIILFTSIHTIVLNFTKESKGIYLYYITLMRPESFIISKIIYHIFISIILSILTCAIFAIWFGFPIAQKLIFLLTITLGSMSFSIIYTLMSAISYHTQNTTIVASILGFPLTIPVITYVSKLCRESFATSVSDNFLINLSMLIGFNIIMVVLSVILYPYIWRD